MPTRVYRLFAEPLAPMATPALAAPSIFAIAAFTALLHAAL
jgi:hypothetical protein